MKLLRSVILVCAVGSLSGHAETPTSDRSARILGATEGNTVKVSRPKPLTTADTLQVATEYCASRNQVAEFIESSFWQLNHIDTYSCIAGAQPLTSSTKRAATPQSGKRPDYLKSIKKGSLANKFLKFSTQSSEQFCVLGCFAGCTNERVAQKSWLMNPQKKYSAMACGSTLEEAERRTHEKTFELKLVLLNANLRNTYRNLWYTDTESDRPFYVYREVEAERQEIENGRRRLAQLVAARESAERLKKRQAELEVTKNKSRKANCTEYGFKPDTDSHAECVMQLAIAEETREQSRLANEQYMANQARYRANQAAEIELLAEAARQEQALREGAALIQLGNAIATGQPVGLPSARSSTRTKPSPDPFPAEPSHSSAITVPVNQTCPIIGRWLVRQEQKRGNRICYYQ